MITNGTITHPGSSSIHLWQSPHELLNAFLVGILTTVLIYQITAILFDLCVGLKRTGQAKISTIASVLLAEHASPFSTLAAIFPAKSFSPWQHHGFRTKCPVKYSHQSAIPSLKLRVVLKFLFLLLLAPVLSLVGVALSIEREQDVTFRGAAFGGISLGLGDTSHIQRNGAGSICILLNTNFPLYEDPLAEFFSCSYTMKDTTPHRFEIPDATAEFIVSRGVANERVPRGSISGIYRNSTFNEWVFIHAEISAGGETFRLKPSVSLQDGIGLVAKFMQVLGTQCERVGKVRVSDQLDDPEKRDERWTVAQDLKCGDFSDDTRELAIREFRSSIAVVNHERMQVLPLSGNESDYVSGDDLLLLRRRQPLLNVIPLSIVCACTVLLRAFVRLATNNDIHRGVELIMKHNLGMRSCDSMLQSRRVARFADIATPVEKFNDIDLDEYRICDNERW